MINNRFFICVIAVLALAVSCDGLPGATVPVESVSLNKSDVTLAVGETVSLEVSVLPSAQAILENVVWTSTEPTVASVDATGLVVALAEGSSTITASVGGKSASCIVRVTAEKIEVTSLVLNRTELVLPEGRYETLVATVLPDEASGRVLQWTSSDASVASVKDGLVTAVKAGSAVITVAVDNLSARCDVTVTESDENALGGGEHEGTTEEDILN